MATIERRNIVGMQKVAALMVQDLVANGFDLLGLNGTTSNTDLNLNDFTGALLAPTKAVDPVAVEYGAVDAEVPEEVRQPWRLLIEASDEDGDIRIFANTPTNIISEASGEYRTTIFEKGASGVERRSGFLGKGAHYLGAGADSVYFDQVLRPNPAQASTFNVAQWNIDLKTLDYGAIPFSYRLTISKHGIAFLMWVESRDSDGKSFGWFNIQRMVDEKGVPVTQAAPGEKEKKAPLFCVFSPNGGGGEDLDVPDPYGVMQFVVREVDVNAPTIPRSATVDGADSSRIINSVQQVATTEENAFVLKTLRGLVTQRNAYPYELDLMCYTSADVVPQWNEPKSTLFGEDTPRTYKAMNANHKNNTGMRILMLIDGAPLA